MRGLVTEQRATAIDGAEASPRDPVEVARGAFIQATRSLRAAINRCDPSRDRLNAVTDGLAELAAGEPGKRLAFVDMATLAPHVAARIRRYTWTLTHVIAQLLAEGSRGRDFVCADPWATASQWVRIADVLPRRLAGYSPSHRQRLCKEVFVGLACVGAPGPEPRGAIPGQERRTWRRRSA